MDKSQADAVAQSVLEPSLQAQNERRHKQAARAAHLARKQRVASFVLAGSVLGVAGAYVSDTPFLLSFILGGLAGAAVGWLVTRRVAG